MLDGRGKKKGPGNPGLAFPSDKGTGFLLAQE
jgi:hypothetical protein